MFLVGYNSLLQSILYSNLLLDLKQVLTFRNLSTAMNSPIPPIFQICRPVLNDSAELQQWMPSTNQIRTFRKPRPASISPIPLWCINVITLQPRWSQGKRVKSTETKTRIHGNWFPRLVSMLLSQGRGSSHETADNHTLSWKMVANEYA